MLALKSALRLQWECIAVSKSQFHNPVIAGGGSDQNGSSGMMSGQIPAYLEGRASRFPALRL